MGGEIRALMGLLVLRGGWGANHDVRPESPGPPAITPCVFY